LDPEQNTTFGDHYLEVDYDISKVMFVLTANSLHTIPKPLLDRMEVISITGYTEVEKYNIVRKYLLTKQMEAHGLKEGDLEMNEEAVYALIRNYTREAGVRNLERVVATVCRKTAKKIVERRNEQQSIEAPAKSAKTSKTGKATSASVMIDTIHVSEADLEEMLGPAKYLVSKAEEQSEIGLTNGLAYTDAGGDMLQIEVSVVPGKGAVKITGKLGEVMQESAATAMSYVRSRAHLLGLDKDFYSNVDIHLHVPEGAVPKDGPSAGITMATAITSALTKIPVRKDVAMTGEITLRGRVLPIGGLKEKLLAAKIGNIKTVLIPKGNVPDLKKINKEITKGMKIVPVEHGDQVLRLALELENPEEFLMRKGIGDLPTTAIPSTEMTHDESVKH
jgi:ATP-dependent Lon protease